MHRRTAISALIVGSALFALSGCAPGPATTSSTTSAEAASTDVGTAPVTISLISTPESGASTKATIAAFEKKYPNVTVDYTQTNYDDYNKSVNLELQSDTAPDVVLLNSVGNTVKNGLVLDLDPYADLYGWTNSYPANQLAQWRVGSDGVTLGDGGLYAAPAGFSEVGVYYNKALATQLGITAPPSTLDEFEADLNKAKAAGILPLQVGNAEGSASFIVQVIGQSIDGASNYSKWVYGQKGATFDSKGNQTGAEKLADWAAQGLISSDANGLTAQGAVEAFVGGSGLFFIDGNWDAAAIATGLGTDAGFIPFPGEKATAIGTSVAYGISAKSQHPNAAAAFLNFLGSPEASANQFAQGFLPVDASAATPTAGTVQADLVSAWAKISADDGLVGFNNNATSTMSDTLKSTTQELIAARISPADFIAAVQKDWDAVHGG